LVCDITPKELSSLLSKITPGGRNALMRYLRAIFNHGIKHSYLTENPISRLDFAKRKREEVETIPVDKVEAMLLDALENDLELLPYLVFGFYSGIRPDGELQKLEWSDVKLSDQVIVIRPEIAKKNRRRFPKISENAAAWIEAYRQRGGTFDGKVSPFTDKALENHRRKNWRRAGITRWITQGMRHTHCSNWLCAGKDINELLLLCGHMSVSTTWEHYYKGTTEQEAKRFWAIMPPCESPNVIAFQTS
jgi:integrase